jgi:hypothetical protein
MIAGAEFSSICWGAKAVRDRRGNEIGADLRKNSSGREKGLRLIQCLFD